MSAKGTGMLSLWLNSVSVENLPGKTNYTLEVVPERNWSLGGGWVILASDVFES